MKVYNIRLYILLVMKMESLKRIRNGKIYPISTLEFKTLKIENPQPGRIIIEYDVDVKYTTPNFKIKTVTIHDEVYVEYPKHIPVTIYYPDTQKIELIIKTDGVFVGADEDPKEIIKKTLHAYFMLFASAMVFLP